MGHGLDDNYSLVPSQALTQCDDNDKRRRRMIDRGPVARGMQIVG